MAPRWLNAPKGSICRCPDKKKALIEFKRVLKDDGLLAIAEFLPDPDYPRRKTVTDWCKEEKLEQYQLQ